MTKPFLFLSLFLLPIIAISQDSSKSETISDSESWRKGYIVLKKQTDTLKGFLDIKYSSFADGYVKSFRFRTSKDKKEGTLTFSSSYHDELDTVRYWGINSKHYKYFNYTDDSIPTKRFQTKNSLEGWVEIIDYGKINISKGFAISEFDDRAGKIYTPMYCLKKAEKPTILVAALPLNTFNRNDWMSQPIDERNKMHFISVISDNPELSERVKTKTLTFLDIQNIIGEYNNKSK
jgi:hypothetical protein